MLVYKDLVTGDELCSDAYPQLPPFGQQDLMEVGFEVKSNKRAKGNDDFGISHNDEEEFAGGDDQVEIVIDIIDSFRLQEITLSKKEYESYIKKYMKKINTLLADNNPGRVDVFKKHVTTFVKHVLSNFDDFNFYMGESMELEGGLVYSYYNGEELAPRFVYLIDGLKEERY